jgi:hypothetical protein
MPRITAKEKRALMRERRDSEELHMESLASNMAVLNRLLDRGEDTKENRERVERIKEHLDIVVHKPSVQGRDLSQVRTALRRPVRLRGRKK